MGLRHVLLPVLLAACVAAPAAGEPPVERRNPGPPDPVRALVRRMDVFLHAEELEGITRDPRFELNPAEFTRLSVVCQLLGYLELDRSIPETHTHRADIVERADFLVDHFALIHSGSASDGMLGYALLGAWEQTGDPRYLEKGQFIVEQAKLLRGFQASLNWGLMSGMALARSWRMSHDADALRQLDVIVANSEHYLLPNGSYPHVCQSAPDVHYTAWMTMELITIARELDDPVRMQAAARSAAFLAGRVGPGGVTSYTAVCPGCPGFQTTFWSLGNGCYGDYDTRGWVNELGYFALAFDQMHDPRYGQVMSFLASLENHGAYPDKWDWQPPADDPIYPWGSSPRSVVRTSILFWTLASILSNREHPSASGHAVAADTPEGAGPGDVARARPASSATTIAPAGAGAAADDGAPGLAWDAPRALLRFGLAAPGPVRLDLFDVRGRLVRRLLHEDGGAGARAVSWDRRDDEGRQVAPGLYFARLVAGERQESARLAVR
jgi:hypothetical protein